ncbi:peptidylprolyl isomerase [Candidatus Woesearchaeota archaeon]|jgi:peptidylprolyl isomerase|nr:peptidylprolyl isomerase [Candidatus Woesearchaeota archaeon]MBT4150824.1 peptidylprolyl isomerase [Candidatus Woesearchaeota archaeon]MBT4246929.1 peptidylprolyl isomerase [Candidatus Woesearchaeota archaeon]MBT4433614.1 peptidylprolyl isomerase [Candidatus Woesearchaeota archaeon]MBT7331796.1 peptidylprolyl isomerase [Candidatus Woesearchaeota archaeon]
MKTTILILGLLTVLFIAGCGGEEPQEETTMKTATFDTTLGTFKLELFTDSMPITTKNFIDLAEKGFYDGTRFHRVISGFMVQGGDPLSKEKSKVSMWGTGDPGYKIQDEFTNANKNDRGTISMANAGPNTGGSQFFINVVNNNFLDDKHPVFGKVVEGMDIVDLIVNTPTASQDRPKEDVVVNKVTIE